MKNKKPLISVILPVYNVEHYIARTIENMLRQTFDNFELIVINDASTDNTLSIIKAYQQRDPRIKIINNKKNLQIAGALNRGIKMARADIIARMDSDDISHPTRLEVQYNFLKANPSVAIVGANILILNTKGKIIAKREYPTTSPELKKIMFRYSPFAHPVVMARKEIIEEFGGYDTSMVPCEDIDLWFKIGSKYEFASIPKPLLKYTLIITSNSHKKLKALELLGFRIKLNAIKTYGYRPSLYDIVYNVLEFVTLWFMPAGLRIWLYIFLRSNKLI